MPARRAIKKSELVGFIAAECVMPFMEDTVALWNRLKCAIDAYSRYLKNVVVPHKHLHPEGAVWLRLVKTILLHLYKMCVYIYSIQKKIRINHIYIYIYTHTIVQALYSKLNVIMMVL